MKTTRANITYILVSIISVVILASSIYQYRIQREVFLERAKEKVYARLGLVSDNLTTIFSGVARDMLILRDLPQLSDFLNAEASEKKELREKVEAMFHIMSLNKEFYDQIRFINDKGIEIFRVDNRGKGPETVPVGRLQNKSGRYYFKAAINMDYGDIYVSNMDLNIEHGVIEEPYQPIIRYATTVLDRNSRKKGVVVLNVKAGYMLDIIRDHQKHAGTGEHYYFLNEDGYYIVHPDRDKEWGFMLGKDNILSNDEPVLTSIMEMEDKGSLTIFSKMFNDDRFFVFYRVYPFLEMPRIGEGMLPGEKGSRETAAIRASSQMDSSFRIYPGDISWTLLYSADFDSLIPSFRELTVGMGLFFVGLLIAGVVISAFFAWRQSLPIQSLASAASKISDGDFSVRADITTKDEIGSLGKVFNDMAKTLESKQEQEKTFQRRLQEETVLAQEQERRNLAQDIHDNLGHSLAIANMKMQKAKSNLPEGGEDISDSLEEGITLIKGMIQETRTLIFDLYPVMLDDFGLIKTIERYVQDFSAKTGVKTEFIISGSPGEPPRSISLYLFRTIKELLNNALKHASAEKISVTVHGLSGILGVTVVDDGVGFDAPAFLRSSPDFKGIGLFSIRERVKRLGGTFLIESTPGLGTRVVIETPVRKG